MNWIRRFIRWVGTAADNVRLQRLVENKLACANQMRIELNRLRGEMAKCRAILGYDEGDLLDNVTRYKKYAEGEISLRDEKARNAIAHFERLTRIETAACELETYLFANTGHTADWPVSITTRGDKDGAVANEVCARLQRLREALK